MGPLPFGHLRHPRRRCHRQNSKGAQYKQGEVPTLNEQGEEPIEKLCAYIAAKFRQYASLVPAWRCHRGWLCAAAFKYFDFEIFRKMRRS